MLFWLLVLCVFFKSVGSVEPPYNCSREWPQLAIFVPFQAHVKGRNLPPKYYEFETHLLRTFLFFWPLKASNTSIIFGYDEEKQDWQHVKEVIGTVNEIKQRGVVPGGISSVPLKQSNHYSSGYNRQRYVMFWGDNYTDAEFIGFGDTDIAFITYVDREDLFDSNDRPVVLARGPYHPPGDGVSLWSEGTFRTLGILEPFNCMSYFPVIVKSSHLRDMREYMMRHHNMTTFDDVFRLVIQAQSFCQFSIMCTYLYAFKREEYSWFVHFETPGWNGVDPPPHSGQSGNMSDIPMEMRVPKPRIVTHAGHRRTRNNPIRNINSRMEMNIFMQDGFCISPPFPRTEQVCQNHYINQLGYYKEMHNFDYIDYVAVTPAEALIAEFTKRRERIANCTPEFNVNDNDLKMILKSVENMSQSGGWRTRHYHRRLLYT